MSMLHVLKKRLSTEIIFMANVECTDEMNFNQNAKLALVLFTKLL